jgi:TP901 family phage tail tape measure protein
MAKVISDEILKLKIIINGDEAQKRVLDLELANKKLGDTLTDLKTEIKNVDSERKKEIKTLEAHTNKVQALKSKLEESEIAHINNVRSLRQEQAAHTAGSKEYQKYEQKIAELKQKSIIQNRELEHSLQSLVAQQKVLADKNEITSAKYKSLQAEIEKATTELTENKRKIDEETKAMNIMSLTTDQLQKRISDLSYSMKHMNPNSPAYRQASEEMNRLNNRLREVRTGTTQSAFSLQNLSDKFNQYSGIATAAIATLAGVAFSIQSVIDANNKMADAQTAVSKTTGLSIQQVKELTAAFTEFDTRTKKIDLLKIAEIGGRLGIPKEEIKGFTQEMDKAYVALGDSFGGGVESVANKLGILKGLFKETRGEDVVTAVNQIGSALNELGAAGTASEENMADFANRVGQLPEALKPTIAEALALGGAFEESGITAERASSGYNKFVRVAATETAEFAKVMHISQKEVKDLINQDPLQFFLKFAEGAKGLDAVKLSEVLEGLKLNDGEVIATIGAASESTDRFRKSIELSNQALTEATSLQSEFDKVNNNSAAIYEKVQKKLIGMFTSPAVAKGLNWLIETIGKLLGVVEDTEGNVTATKEAFFSWFKIITIGVVAVISYNTALGLTSLTLATVKERLLAMTVIQKINNFLNQSGAIFQNGYNLAVGYGQLAIGKLTGSTNIQTAAQTRLNLVTRANPFALVFTIVMTLVAAYILLSKRADEAAEKQKMLNDVRASAAQAVQDEKANLQSLLLVAKDETLSKEARLAAIKKLNQISPEYLGNLTLENIRTAEGAKLINDYVKALDRKAMAEALSSKRSELFKKQIEIQSQQVDPGWKNLGGLGTYAEQKLNSGNKLREISVEDAKKIDAMTRVADIEKELSKYVPLVQQAYKKRREELVANYKQMSSLNEEQKKFVKLNPFAYTDEPTSNYTPLGDKEKKAGKTDEEKAADKALRKYQSQREKILESAKDYNQKMEELEALRLAAMATLQQDGFEKERDMILAEEAKNIAELEKKKVQDDDFALIRSMIAKEKGEMRKKLQEIEYEWLEENGRLSQLQELEAEKTKMKLLVLDEKYIRESYKKQEEALADRLRLIERQKNIASSFQTVNEQKTWLENQGYSEENLRKIRTWEEGRAAIEKFYLQKKLDEQVSYLNKALAEFQVIMAANPISITPDQMKIIQDYKDQIAALMAEIAKLKNGDTSAGNLGGKLSSFGGQGDILGLTPDQWEAMFTKTDKLTENIQKVAAAIQVMKNMMAAYSEFAAANEQKLLQQYEASSERKQTRLDKQLKAGIITQEVYKKATIKNDKDLDKKKAELEYKQAKRQRAMAIAQTIANTALAIMGIWAQFPKADYGIMAGIMSGVVGVLGAVQVATILGQPLPEAPGAEEGFYPTVRKQDGKLFNARKRQQKTGVYDEPTLLVGEQGAGFPELVVTQKTARRIDPDISNAYMREIARVEGAQDGYYKNVKNTPSSTSSGSDEVMIKLISSIDSFNQTMQQIKDEGLDARIGDSFSNGEKIDKMVKGYQNLYNNSKHG